MIVMIPAFNKYVRSKMDIGTFKGLKPKDKREVFLRWKYGFSNMATNEALSLTDKYLVNRVKELVSSPDFVEKHTVEGKKSQFLSYMQEKVRFQEYSDTVLQDVESNNVY